MAKLSQDDILQAVSDMSVMELVDLIKAIEEKFDVSAAQVAVAAPAAAGAGDGAAAEAQSEFDVILTNCGSNKIAVIKVVRAITELGLKEAKDMVDAAPSSIKSGVNKEESESIKAQLEEAGGQVELK